MLLKWQSSHWKTMWFGFIFTARVLKPVKEGWRLCSCVSSSFALWIGKTSLCALGDLLIVQMMMQHYARCKLLVYLTVRRNVAFCTKRRVSFHGFEAISRACFVDQCERFPHFQQQSFTRVSAIVFRDLYEVCSMLVSCLIHFICLRLLHHWGGGEAVGSFTLIVVKDR